MYSCVPVLSQTAGMGGVDLAGLLSNPGFMNMVRTLWFCQSYDIHRDVRRVGLGSGLF